MSANPDFAWPAMLLLLPLPWLLGLFMPPMPPVVALRLPDLSVYATQAQQTPSRLPGLAWLAWVLLVLAAARPQLPDLTKPLPTSGRSLMLAVDLSASMATRDLALHGAPVERFAAARKLVREFLARRQGDRVGLVVFGKSAYVHVPPTYDLPAVDAALASSAVGMAGNETALGDAIALATKQLRDQPEPARVLVLLTDGANTSGSLGPQRAAWLAQREGIRIHAVGIGSAPQAKGGNPAFDLDEPTLQGVSTQTGGQYQRATDGSTLEAFFRMLDELEQLPDQDAARRPPQELFFLPLLGALAIFLGLLIRQRRAQHSGAFARLVDPHLLPHVCHHEPPRRIPLATATAGLLGLLAMLLAWVTHVREAESFRPTTLRILVADLSAPEHDARMRSSLARLLDALPPGETALLLYAGDAYVAVPPTRDTRNISALLPELSANIMPLPGQRPDLAFRLARELAGRSLQGETKFIWVTARPETVPMLGAWGNLLDLNAPDVEGRIDAITRMLERANHWIIMPRAWRDSAAWLPALLVALMLPFAAMGMRRLVWFAVLPAPTFALALFALASHAPSAEASMEDGPWQAVAHYRAGRYAEALALLQNRDDAVSHYNRGNTLVRLGRFVDAEAAYLAALEKNPADADARFNLELVRRLRNPPPPSSPPRPPIPDKAPPPPADAEAERVAEQWLRGVPDNPGGLLRAKLKLEHERRSGGRP